MTCTSETKRASLVRWRLLYLPSALDHFQAAVIVMLPNVPVMILVADRGVTPPCCQVFIARVRQSRTSNSISGVRALLSRFKTTAAYGIDPLPVVSGDEKADRVPI